MKKAEQDALDRSLFRAVCRKDLPEVKLLLEKGANIESSGAGVTPLLNAVEMDHLEMVKFLISKGADMAVRDGRGDTPLIRAVARGNTEMVKLLLAAGADINARNKDGFSAVAFAVDDMPTLEVLLAAGADVNAQNNRFETPLMLAIIKGTEEAVSALLAKNPRLDLWDCTRRTALHYAARTGKEKIIRLVAEAGSEMNVRDSQNKTPEDYARTDGLKALFRTLRKETLERELSVYKKGTSRPLKATKPLGRKP